MKRPARRRTPEPVRGIPGVSACMVCRERLREDRARGERVCGNRACAKYVPGAETLPEC